MIVALGVNAPSNLADDVVDFIIPPQNRSR